MFMIICDSMLYYIDTCNFITCKFSKKLCKKSTIYKK